MNEKTLPAVFVISGKSALSGQGGYAVAGFNWGLIFFRLGYPVKIFCIGSREGQVKTPAGHVYVSSSILSSIFPDVEMAGLLLVAPKLALSMLRSLPDNQPTIIWGLGPWTLAGAIVKLFKRNKIILLGNYFTSMKHEYQATVSAITIKDYGLLTKIKVILTYLTVIPFYSLWEKFLLSQTDKIITHYASTEKILTDQFGIEDSKFFRLPYHVEIIKRKGVFQAKKLILGKPLIVLVCRHDGRKGINFLLHAFAILNHRQVKYSAVIIGAGPLKNKHISLAQKLNLTNVYQPGFVPDIKPYLKKADLFVFPSLEEGSSALSILEAMKEGLPIISTNVDGIPEDLIDHHSALLVPPKDPVYLADAMQKLLTNRKLAAKLGKQAKIRYYQKYHLNKIKKEAKNLLKTYGL